MLKHPDWRARDAAAEKILKLHGRYIEKLDPTASLDFDRQDQPSSRSAGADGRPEPRSTPSSLAVLEATRPRAPEAGGEEPNSGRPSSWLGCCQRALRRIWSHHWK